MDEKRPHAYMHAEVALEKYVEYIMKQLEHTW